MAININILTKFDSKGLRIAKKELGAATKNLQDASSSLGRNFAVAGVALAGIAVGLSKTVGQASNLSESVNAINVAFGDSAKGILDFGKTASTALGVSQVDFNNAAVRFSAFAEKIVGSGKDSSKFIAEITTRASDFASVFNIDVAEALGVFQSGLSGEAEPLKRFGINLLDSEVKAYAAANGIGKLGQELTAGEKTQARYGLLMQETNKVSGDFKNTADGLANGTRILTAQFTDLQAEIGNALLPAIQGAIPAVKEMIAEIGPKLKAAVESVDWAGLIKSVVDFTLFLIQNGEAIAKAVTALWALSTILKTITVVMAATKALSALYTTILVAQTTATGGLTVAQTLLNAAMIANPIGVVVVALGLLAGALYLATTAANANKTAMTGANSITQKYDLKPATTGWNKYGIAVQGATDKLNGYKSAAGVTPPANYTSHVSQILAIQNAWTNAWTAKGKYEGKDTGGMPTKPGTSVEVVRNGVWMRGTWNGKKYVWEKISWNNTPAGGTGGGGGGDTAGAAKSAKSTTVKWAVQVKQALAKQKEMVSKVVQEFIDITPTEQWTEFGSQAGIKIVKGIQNSLRQVGSIPFIGKGTLEKTGKQFKKIYDQVAVLQEQFIKRTEFQTGLKTSIMSMFDFDNIGKGIDGIIKKFKTQVEQTKQFRDNLIELQKLGLTGDLFKKIAESQDFSAAAELVKGGAGAISEVNALYAQLQGFSEEIATVSGNQLYNLGVDAATGFVRTLEDGFTSLDAYSKKLTEQTYLKTYIRDLEARISGQKFNAFDERTKKEMKATLAGLKANYAEQFGGRANQNQMMSLQNQTTLDTYFSGGGQMTQSLAAQIKYASLSSEEQRALSRSNNFTINVTGGISTSAQIGQSVIDAILAYEKSSGQVYARA